MSKKALIIDDDPSLRMLLNMTLKSKGFECVEACDGQEGFRQALKNLPDLIVMDLSMPNMNGFEACEKIRGHEKTSGIPILVLSGESTGLNREILEGSLKANGFLAKPFDRARLLEALGKIVPNLL
jgi:CheY-like chemotaxis protein